MNQIEQIPNLIRQGFTNCEIAKQLKIAISTVSSYRNGFPSQKIVQLLNANPNFKNEFIEIYTNNSLIKTVELLQKHPLFQRHKKINCQRISEFKKFYEIDSKMPERIYNSEIDRIKGYMIRNSKFTAKRRGIYFDLKYTDIELPEYCPLLNIKLTFRLESSGNDFHHASLDRIDNSKGYVKGNVLVISRLANAMKNQANFEQLELFANNILKLIQYYKDQDALAKITDVFPDIKLKT